MKDLERGFLLGACEDGTVYYKKSRNQYTIEIEQKERGWLEFVQGAFLSAYDKRSKIYMTSKGYYRLVVYSKMIFGELTNMRACRRRILAESPSYQLGYLRGIFDAEGTVHRDRFQIRVSSSKLDTISIVKKMLDASGISYGKISADKTAYVLPLYGKKNISNFNRKIGFRHPEKMDRLSRLIF